MAFGLLLLVPPVVIAVVWWWSVHFRSLVNRLPDTEALIMARFAGFLCAVLPIVQLFTGMIRYRLGILGHSLVYAIPGVGVLLALAALTALLSYAHGYERLVSPSMVLLSTCTLLLLTFTGTHV